MRKTRICAFAMLSLLVVSLTALTPSRAADYTKIGVRIGDTATYSFAATGWTVDRFTISVLDVNGTLVKLNATYYNPNGSVNHTMILGPANVSRGQLGEYLLCANLSAHDPICYVSEHSTAPAFSETVQMTVAGASRTVNHLNMSTPSIMVDRWWDKATGLLVKRVHLAPYSINLTLISTSLWSAGGGLFGLDTTATLLLIGGFLVAGVFFVGATLVIHGRGKRGKEQLRPPTQMP
jgi:hypothetical protein